MIQRLFRTPCAYVNVMAGAAMQVAGGLLRDFGEVENLQVSPKSPEGFVSAADRRSERLLEKLLCKTFPDFGFLLEEEGHKPGKDPRTFVIDPLDGTLNFLHGLPHFAISLSLCRNNQAFAAVTLDPVRDELFWASEGKGTFCGHRKLRMRKTDQGTRPHQRLVALNRIEPTQKYWDTGGSVRISGSTTLDLAYVAAGRFDGFLGHGLSLWDTAAGELMIKEAGGVFQQTTYDAKTITLASTSGYAPTLRNMFLPHDAP